MNALELMHRLKDSGTGAAKMDAARAVARARGTPLRDLPGAALLEEMQRRHEKWRMLMDMGGPGRQHLALPPECLPSQCWPEGTLAKAARLLQGLPADPPAMEASTVYDIDEAPPAPKPVAKAPAEEPPEPPLPPGIHAAPAEAQPGLPGIQRKGSRTATRAEAAPGE